MSEYDKLSQVYGQQLLKAIKHLSYSYKKVQKLPSQLKDMDEEILETWESFSARFARVSEIFLSPYIRSLVLKDDPGFQGTFRDFLNKAEKFGLIDDVKVWLKIRELRNKTAHEYNEKALEEYFHAIFQMAPILLALEGKVSNAP